MRSISVVIPTVGRAELVRAVECAIAQSTSPKEVLVVADTVDPIELPSNPLLKLIRVGPGAGGNVARQAGIAAATGDLIALLDDDDEWHTDHLSHLLDVVPAQAFADNRWIASSRLYAQRFNGKAQVWPKRLKTQSETIPQYIFRKKSLVGGVGFIQASTLLFPKVLGLEVPFDPSLKFHQDIAWLVDLSKQPYPVTVYQSPTPTVTYHIGSSTVSKRITASQSRKWADRLDQGDLRTLGDFITVHSIQGAKNSGSLMDMFSTIYFGLRHGRPGIWAISYAFALVVRSMASRMYNRIHPRNLA